LIAVAIDGRCRYADRRDDDAADDDDDDDDTVEEASSRCSAWAERGWWAFGA